jgi:hypothetical protein
MSPPGPNGHMWLREGQRRSLRRASQSLPGHTTIRKWQNCWGKWRRWVVARSGFVAERPYSVYCSPFRTQIFALLSLSLSLSLSTPAPPSRVFLWDLLAQADLELQIPQPQTSTLVVSITTKCRIPSAPQCLLGLWIFFEILSRLSISPT